MTATKQWDGPCQLRIRPEPRSHYARQPMGVRGPEAVADATISARQLALAGIEVRATQADAGGGGGKTAHEPAGSPKGGQFTHRPGSGGSKATHRPKKAAAPQNVPQAPATPRLVREGDSGEDVRYAQYAMSLLGFNVAQDGRFGPETATAVKQMQQRLGMKHPNGHITPALLHKMQDAVRLSPCVGGQRDLAFEAQWEQRDDDDLDETAEAVLDAIDEFERSTGAEWDERAAHDVSKELRIPGGKGGGRWTKNPVTSAIAHALEEWAKGNGPDDPFTFDGKPIDREPLRKAAVARGISLKRGASREDIVSALKDDLKVKVADAKAAKSPDAGKPVRFTLKGGADPKLAREIEVENRVRAAYRTLDAEADPANRGHVGLNTLRDAVQGVPRGEIDDAIRRMTTGRDASGSVKTIDFGGNSHQFLTIADPSPRPLPDAKLRNLDVGVFHENGKLALWEVSDSGERRKRVALVDDLAGLESWANEHGESELAGWARKERGGAEVPKAPAKKAAPRTPLAPGGADDLAEEFYRNPKYTEQQILDRLSGLNLAELKKVARATNVALPRELVKTEAGPVFLPLKKISADELRQHIASTIARDRKLLGVRVPNDAPDVPVAKAVSAVKAVAPDVNALRTLDTEARRDALDLRKVDELKALLREQGLPVSGKKRDLVDRLVGHLDGDGTAAAANVRPSGLPTDRKLVSGDFDDLAGRLIGKNEQQILDLLADLNASELARLALKYEGARKARSTLGTARGAKSGLRFPDDVTSADARRLWLAQKLVSDRKIHGAWRSQEPDEDGIERAEETDLDETDAEEDDDDEPTLDQIRAMAGLNSEARARELALLGVTRALGHDVTPGHDELHHYWTRGEGLAKWAESPKPWTTLVAHLTKYVGPEKAKIFASRWFIEVFHYAAGSDLNRVTHGKPPRGHRVGPG